MPRTRSIHPPITRIKEALDELAQILAQSVDRAAASPKAKKQRAAKSNAVKSPGGRRPSLDRDKILALVRSKKRGMSAGQLASALRTNPAALGYHLKLL